MSQKPPQLTDRASLLMHRTRATQAGMFLQDLVREDIQDRLSMVNRDFKSIAIVTGFPEVWRAHFPTATIVADEDTLALTPKAHDLVIHALSLHWANDPVGQLIQCRHALKNDGLLLTASFGGQTLHELRSALAQAESDLTGGLTPRILPMGEIRDLGALLQRAGFALPVADSLPISTTYQSLFHLIHELRAMGETNALHGRSRLFSRRALFARAQDIYATTFSENDRIIASFEVIFMTGWAPDDSQPKPLRPGSAAQRLADALGTDEKKLP